MAGLCLCLYYICLLTISDEVQRLMSTFGIAVGKIFSSESRPIQLIVYEVLSQVFFKVFFYLKVKTHKGFYIGRSSYSLHVIRN